MAYIFVSVLHYKLHDVFEIQICYSEHTPELKEMHIFCFHFVSTLIKCMKLII